MGRVAQRHAVQTRLSGPSVRDHREQVTGRLEAATVTEVSHDLPGPAAGQVKGGQGMRQQRRARRPRHWPTRVSRDRPSTAVAAAISEWSH